MGVFTFGKVKWYSFCDPKKYKPTKQAFWCTKIWIDWCSGTVEFCLTVGSQTFSLEGKGWVCCNGDKNSTFWLD